MPEPESAATPAAPQAPSLTALPSLFSQRPFRNFWLARLGGTTANQMLMVALAWNMYALTSSAWDLGLVGLYQFGAAFLLTLPAGHVADRVHRGRLFAACMALQMVVALILTLAALHGFMDRSLLLGISLLLGAARAFQMPSQQALVPQLVRPAQLQKALTVNSAAMQAAIIGGPALGGALYVHGVTTVYSVSFVFFLLAGIFSLRVHYDHEPAPAHTGWTSVFDGVRFVWQKKVILGATTLDLFAVLLGGATALLPIFARDMLHTGPIGLGLLRGAPAAGSLCMSLALIQWPLQRWVGRKLLIAVAIFGLATVVFGISTSFWLSLLALAISGAADTISVVTRSNLVQLETPNDMRGRVSAVNSLFIGASNQLGEFESGSVAAVWGPVASVVSGGIGTLLIAAAWFKLFPALAKRDTMGG